MGTCKMHKNMGTCLCKTSIDMYPCFWYYNPNNKTTQHKHNEARSTKRLRRCKLRKVINAAVEKEIAAFCYSNYKQSHTKLKTTQPVHNLYLYVP